MNKPIGISPVTPAAKAAGHPRLALARVRVSALPAVCQRQRWSINFVHPEVDG